MLSFHNMNPESLGFSTLAGVFSWKGDGVEQVIQIEEESKAHSYCEVCVNSIPYKSDRVYLYVVCCVTWHELSLAALPSWDLIGINRAVRSSRPAVEIPSTVAKILESLRSPQAIYDWLQRFSGARPPAFYWLSMLAAHWAGDDSGALAAIDNYIEKLTVGSELHKEGVLAKAYLARKKII